jgi:hypothetical protein
VQKDEQGRHELYPTTADKLNNIRWNHDWRQWNSAPGRMETKERGRYKAAVPTNQKRIRYKAAVPTNQKRIRWSQEGIDQYRSVQWTVPGSSPESKRELGDCSRKQSWVEKRVGRLTLMDVLSLNDQTTGMQKKGVN